MHQDTPLVSIIMPTYNRAGYILETIDCIIAQTYAHWELLIIDDGSTDNTELHVKSINDSRIQYYKFERTGITGKLKNFGIHKATGDLIAFMDSDDLWPDGKLQKQVRVLLEHPDAGFSFTNGFNFLANGDIDAIFYPKQSGYEIKRVFLPYCRGEIGVFIQSVIVWKKNILPICLFKENRTFTDYSFIGNLCYHYNAAILFETLFHRRLHRGNNFNSNSYEDYMEYFETINTYIAEGKLQLKDVQNTFFISHIRCGDIMVSLNDRKAARIHYLKAWKYNLFSSIPIKRYIKMYLRNKA